MSRFIDKQRDGVAWIAHPGSRSINSAAAELGGAPTAHVLIGPEGGFTDDEITLAAESGYEKIGLGKRTYRIETAATVIAALLTE